MIRDIMRHCAVCGGDLAQKCKMLCSGTCRLEWRRRGYKANRSKHLAQKRAQYLRNHPRQNHRCIICGGNLRGRHGLRKYCSEACEVTARRKRYEANPEHFRQLSAKSRIKHREKRREEQRRWRESERGREYYRQTRGHRRKLDRQKYIEQRAAVEAIKQFKKLGLIKPINQHEEPQQ